MDICSKIMMLVLQWLFVGTWQWFGNGYKFNLLLLTNNLVKISINLPSGCAICFLLSWLEVFQSRKQQGLKKSYQKHEKLHKEFLEEFHEEILEESVKKFLKNSSPKTVQSKSEWLNSQNSYNCVQQKCVRFSKF